MVATETCGPRDAGQFPGSRRRRSLVGLLEKNVERAAVPFARLLRRLRALRLLLQGGVVDGIEILRLQACLAGINLGLHPGRQIGVVAGGSLYFRHVIRGAFGGAGAIANQKCSERQNRAGAPSFAFDEPFNLPQCRVSGRGRPLRKPCETSMRTSPAAPFPPCIWPEMARLPKALA